MLPFVTVKVSTLESRPGGANTSPALPSLSFKVFSFSAVTSVSCFLTLPQWEDGAAANVTGVEEDHYESRVICRFGVRLFDYLIEGVNTMVRIKQKIVPKLSLRTTALIPIFLVSAAASAQAPKTGYAPVNGLKMYYEIHGKGDPVILLHGSFMTITNNWTEAITQLSKSRQVIAVEMQGHGRTADIERNFSFENLADDIAALLDYLKIKQADVLGYSMGGGVAMQVAIRHPDKVRKVVSISAVFRHDGWVKEAVEMFPKMDPGMFKGSPIEIEYKKLSPTPDQFETFVKRVIQMDIKPYDFGAEKLKATKAPFLFIHGDADGVRLDHISEMFRLKGGEIFGDMRPRSESRLAILPNTTHVTLMDKLDVIVPMVNDFLNAQPQKRAQVGLGYDTK